MPGSHDGHAVCWWRNSCDPRLGGTPSLMDCFSPACKDFVLTISLKKTNVLWQDREEPPDYERDAVSQFTYLDSTITDNLIGRRDRQGDWGGSFSNLARLTARMWISPELSVKTKLAVYNAWFTSTLLYGSETWTTYAERERRLNTFHLRIICPILGISWQDRVVSNADILSHADLPSVWTLLTQRRLRWLGHVCRTEDGRIPKDIQATVSWEGNHRSPSLAISRCLRERYEGCRHRHHVLGGIAPDRTKWRSALKQPLKTGWLHCSGHAGTQKGWQQFQQTQDQT